MAGRYKVYGKFKGSDCEVLVAEKYFAAGTVPETKQLVGQDVCMTNGVADSLVLSVSSRQAGINYYLYSLPGLSNPSLPQNRSCPKSVCESGTLSVVTARLVNIVSLQ